MQNRKEMALLGIGYIGSMIGLCGVIAIYQSIIMSLPLIARMICSVVTYWIIALVPFIIILVNKEKFSDYGFVSQNIGKQIVIGIMLGIGMSLILTLIPHIAGFGEFVDSGKRYKFLWQFAYEIVYCVVAVGLVEEFVFRGFIYEKIKKIFKQEYVAVAGSSVLFGLFHIFGGNVVQIMMTAAIGAFFCFCRLKIKNCTIISLIIAHGIYDFLITVWASVL